MARGRSSIPGVDDDPRSVDSLRRGLEILRCFRIGETGLTQAEIVNRLGLSPATTHRLLQTLLQAGYLNYLPAQDEYQPGPACIAIGSAVRESLPALRVARPVMQALADDFRLNVTLATRERLQMLRLEHCHAEVTPTFGIGVGALFPLVSTAIGRAYLWALPQRQQSQLIEQIRSMADAETLRFIPGIYSAFSDLEQFGFCFSVSELIKNARAVAAPLILNDGQAILSMGAIAAGPGANETLLREQVGPRLLAALNEIQAELSRLGIDARLRRGP